MGRLAEEYKLPELHMEHLKTVTKQKAWTDERASAVLNDFVDVIRESNIWGSGVGVDAHQRRALSQKKRTLFGSAQEFAM